MLLTVAYDGTDFCGWQEQPVGIRTAAGVLKVACEHILGQPVKMLGASRTDAGVHAQGQRAHIIGVQNSRVPMDKLAKVLNTVLDDDIAVHDAVITSDNFHPIKDAISKTYSYKILNTAHRNPLYGRFCAYEPAVLDVQKMQEGCKYFVGEHDFAGFYATGSSATTTVRTINFLEIGEDDGVIEMRVNGNGFLYNMVRIIAGTLVDVGLGKVCPADVAGLILAKDRTKTGKTMPAHGLTLLEVFY